MTPTIRSLISIVILAVGIFLASSGMPAALFGQETAATDEVEAAREPASEADELASAAQGLLESIARDRAELADLRAQRDAARGEERLLLDRRVMSKGIETLGRVESLVENVVEQERQGRDAKKYRKAAVDLVSMLGPLFRQRVEHLQSDISDLGNRRESATGNDLIAIETEIAEDNDSLNTILDAALDNWRHMSALGLEASREKGWLTEVLSDRAATEAARNYAANFATPIVVVYFGDHIHRTFKHYLDLFQSFGNLRGRHVRIVHELTHRGQRTIPDRAGRRIRLDQHVVRSVDLRNIGRTHVRKELLIDLRDVVHDLVIDQRERSV